jgi:predicted nucleic acid-binding protein
VAAVGGLNILRSLYDRVLVPFEVCQEILAGSTTGFAVAEFKAANLLQKWSIPLAISFFW